MLVCKNGNLMRQEASE